MTLLNAACSGLRGVAAPSMPMPIGQTQWPAQSPPHPNINANGLQRAGIRLVHVTTPKVSCSQKAYCHWTGSTLHPIHKKARPSRDTLASPLVPLFFLSPSSLTASNRSPRFLPYTFTMADDKTQDTTEKKAPIVDDTPISGVRPNNERKNSLENYLQHRPERAELVESTSLVATNMHALTAKLSIFVRC